MRFYKVGDMIFTIWQSGQVSYITPYIYIGIIPPTKNYMKTKTENNGIIIFVGSDSTLYVISTFLPEIEFNLSSYKYKYYPYNHNNFYETRNYYQINRGYPYISTFLPERATRVGNYAYRLERFKYGIEFNHEREKIGLPILDENWGYIKTHNSGRYSYRMDIHTVANAWVNLTQKRDSPFHYRKFVVFRDREGSIIQERDEYVGPLIEGDDTRTMLYVTYNFVRNRDIHTSAFNDIGWKYELNSDRRYNWVSNISITKETADSIFVAWGLR